MKIRFTSPRSAPDVDHGIRVPYAPPKRQAFRLRWYLILLLVSSPLLYLGWQALLGLWRIEAPGYVERPTIELTAPVAAQVARIVVRENQPVRRGEPLLELQRPELDLRRQTLRQRLAQPAPAPAGDAGQLALLRASLARYQRLFDAGAATRGEVEAARLRLGDAETALRPPAASTTADARERQGWQAELAEVEQLRRNLLLRAPADATVVALNTRPGLSAQAGQTLLSLQERAVARVVALLPPQQARYARAGQSATVVWPSGEAVPARVSANGTVTERIPDTLREFGGSRQGILVRLQLLAPLPARLNVDHLTVGVRFAREW